MNRSANGGPAPTIVHNGRLDAGINFFANPFGKRDLATSLRAALDA